MDEQIVQERISIEVVNNKADSAHNRLDRLERLMEKSLDKLEESFREARKMEKIDRRETCVKLDDVIAVMNKGKAWSAAFLLFAGFLGAFLSKAFGVFLERH